MQEAGDLYTSWEEVAAGNVLILVPNSVYNKVLEFDTFVDASKAGVASSLVSGRKISTVFGIPITSNRLGFGSIFDQKSTAPTTIDATKNNVVAGINIKL